MAMSLGEFLALLGVFVALGGLFALLLLPRLRKFFVVIAILLLMSLVVGCLTFLFRTPAETALGPEEHFSKGVHLYETGRFNSAIDELESFLAGDKPNADHIDDARYYLASAALHLSTPDCEAAVGQLRLIAPDSKGFGRQILEECRSAGCIDCQNLLPFP